MAEIGLYEAMRTTRAVRRLRPDPVPDAVLRRVFEAATWAPSGGNRQPWRVIAVRDAAIKRTCASSTRALGALRERPAPRRSSSCRAEAVREASACCALATTSRRTSHEHR